MRPSLGRRLPAGVAGVWLPRRWHPRCSPGLEVHRPRGPSTCRSPGGPQTAGTREVCSGSQNLELGIMIIVTCSAILWPNHDLPVESGAENWSKQQKPQSNPKSVATFSYLLCHGRHLKVFRN